AGAGHVLCNDCGIARGMPAEVARQQPRIGVIAAADAVADQQGKALSPIEVLDSGSGDGAPDQREGDRDAEDRKDPMHSEVSSSQDGLSAAKPIAPELRIVDALRSTYPTVPTISGTAAETSTAISGADRR